METARRILIWLLAAFLSFSAISKLFWGIEPGALDFPSWIYHGAAVFEVAVVVLLARGSVTIPCSAVMLLAIVGVALAMFSPNTRCGCLGAIDVSRSVHIMMSSSLGALASAVLWLTTGSADDRGQWTPRAS